MHRSVMPFAVSLALLFSTGGAVAQSAPAYSQEEPQASAPAASAPAEADQPAPVADDGHDVLERKIARQNAVIANQKALIAALNGRIASLKRKCP